MGQVTAINSAVEYCTAPPASSTLRWEDASPKQQALALQREALLQPFVELLDKGCSIAVVYRSIAARLRGGLMSPAYAALAGCLARNGNAMPSRSIIFEWLGAYRRQGRSGLLAQYKGRVRRARGWEALAIQLYNRPSKPSIASVAVLLRERHGHADASYASVRRFLASLPATLNNNSPARLGPHYHHQNRRSYVQRDASVLQIGEVYEGDGHTVDAYVAHPNTGKPFRPELTAWIDVRSRYLVGWYLSDAESALSTLFALSHALVGHDHVPAWLHVDNGAGYRAKLMNDDSVGFYARFNISTSFAIPGNSRGKGLIEHWFRTFRDHHDKHWNQGLDYCGEDQAQEINRRLSDQIARGRRRLLSFAEYTASVAAFVEAYNQRPSATLDGFSPAALWRQLERVPVELPGAAVLRPMERRVARRCLIQLHNRQYEHPLLMEYEGRELNVEYDIHRDDQVWVYDDKHRLLCEAALKTKVDWLPQSRLDEARRKRELGRLHRLQKRIDLVRAEAADRFDHADTLQRLARFDALAVPEPVADRPPLFNLDITDHDYLGE